MIDREVARGLEDLRAGRVYGPFASADAMIRSLRGRARRKKAKASTYRAPPTSSPSATSWRSAAPSSAGRA